MYEPKVDMVVNLLLMAVFHLPGYDTLIKNLNELVLDTPEAPTILGNFIARSIADDCIPPKFLQSYKGKVSWLPCRGMLQFTIVVSVII